MSHEFHRWVDHQIAAREAAKAGRDWERADAIRSDLAGKGVTLMDTPTGTIASGGGIEWLLKSKESEIEALIYQIKVRDRTIEVLYARENNYSETIGLLIRGKIRVSPTKIVANPLALPL